MFYWDWSKPNNESWVSVNRLLLVHLVFPVVSSCFEAPPITSPENFTWWVLHTCMWFCAYYRYIGGHLHRFIGNHLNVCILLQTWINWAITYLRNMEGEPSDVLTCLIFFFLVTFSKSLTTVAMLGVREIHKISLLSLISWTPEFKVFTCTMLLQESTRYVVTEHNVNLDLFNCYN